MRFELKNYRGVIFHNIEEWCKVSRKTNSWFQKWHEELVEFSHNHSKVWKFHFSGLFLYEVWTKKKCGGVIFHDTEQWRKIWINPDLVISKIAWGIGWTLIRAFKVWKIVHWCALFVKSIYNVSARKFQRNYVSWHWRAMQNLNWLVAWKKTLGISLIFRWASSWKSWNLHFHGLLLSKE